MSWSQFHQRFTRAFFVQNFGAKNYKAVFGFVTREKLLNSLSYEKRARKMSMKLTPAVMMPSAKHGISEHL